MPGSAQSRNIKILQIPLLEKGEFTLLGKITKHLEFFIVHLYIGLE